MPAALVCDQIRLIISDTPSWGSELVQQTLVEIVRRCSDQDHDLVELVSEYARSAPLLDALSLGSALPASDDLRRSNPMAILDAFRTALPHVHGYLKIWSESLSLEDRITLYEGHIEPFCFGTEDSASTTDKDAFSVKHKLLALTIIVIINRLDSPLSFNFVLTRSGTSRSTGCRPLTRRRSLYDLSAAVYYQHQH